MPCLLIPRRPLHPFDPYIVVVPCAVCLFALLLRVICVSCFFFFLCVAVVCLLVCVVVLCLSPSCFECVFSLWDRCACRSSCALGFCCLRLYCYLCVSCPSPLLQCLFASHALSSVVVFAPLSFCLCMLRFCLFASFVGRAFLSFVLRCVVCSGRASRSSFSLWALGTLSCQH